MNPKTKKLIIAYLPYLLIALFTSKLGLAWRLCEGQDPSQKVLHLM